MSAVAAVSLVGVGTAAAAGTPSKTPLIDAVAARLGVTPDQLQVAFKVTIAEGIDQAVAAGTLTPEQAAKLKQRIAQAQATGPGARGELMKKVEAFKRRLILKSKNQDRVAAPPRGAGRSSAPSSAPVSPGRDPRREEYLPHALVTAITAPAKERLAKAVAAESLRRLAPTSS